MSVLKSLAATAVTERELAKAKNNYEADFIWSFYNSDGLAAKLAQFQSVAKNWRFMSKQLEEIRDVTTKQIQELAGKYLTKDKSTVATLIPTSAEGAVQ